MSPGPWNLHVDDEDRLDADRARRVLGRVAGMLRPYRLPVVTTGAVMVAFTMATLGGPLFVRYGIDRGVRGASTHDLGVAVAGYAVSAVAALMLSRVQILLVTRIGEAFLRDLRRRVFAHLLDQPMAFFDREPTGKLVARMTSDIDSLQEVVQQGLVIFMTNGLLLVFTIVLLVVISPVLAAVCLVSVPVVIVASVKFQRTSNRAYLEVRDRVGQTLSTFQEGISGVRVIQAFGQQERQIERFRRHNSAQLDANLYATKVSAWYFPVVELAGVATTAAVVGIGGVLVHRDVVTIGTITLFALSLANLFEPLQQLSQLFNTLQSAGAALNKLFGLLDVEPALHPGRVVLPGRGAIEVDGVSFSYDGREEVLSDVTLTIGDGERVAFVGPTGAGKSTLAKLVARLYDPTAGAIRFGGVDLREATNESLRRAICVVPQEGFLFYGTIADNVRVGRAGATDDDVLAALARIGVADHFTRLPHGLATEVQERGSRLSAGERQLVSLARAALADPAVLVLDEATSNLDPGTEAEVEQALAALMRGRTVIVIAHRLSTAERADRVAVVDAGGIVELGSHDELVALRGRYAALYASWRGGLAAAS